LKQVKLQEAEVNSDADWTDNCRKAGTPKGAVALVRGESFRKVKVRRARAL
jgi:hypothetical protein